MKMKNTEKLSKALKAYWATSERRKWDDPSEGARERSAKYSSKLSRFTVSIPIDLHTQLKEYCYYEGISMKDMITKTLEGALNNGG